MELQAQHKNTLARTEHPQPRKYAPRRPPYGETGNGADFFASPAFCGSAARKNDFAQMFSCALHQDGLK